MSEYIAVLHQPGTCGGIFEGDWSFVECRKCGKVESTIAIETKAPEGWVARFKTGNVLVVAPTAFSII